MKINRDLAIKILRYLDEHKDFYFPFLVMCKEYSEENNDFIEIEPGEWKNIAQDDIYQTFELWENLQNLDEKTLQLMAKGFLEKIRNENTASVIANIAQQYRKKWDVKLWESTDITEFGLNEYYGGKAEGLEESLKILHENKLRIWDDQI